MGIQSPSAPPPPLPSRGLPTGLVFLLCGVCFVSGWCAGSRKGPPTVGTRPVAYTAPPAAPPTVAAKAGWRVVSIDSRVTESNDVWWRYAWKLTLANDGPSGQTFAVEIEFQDSDGFVIYTDVTRGFFLEAGKEDTFTGYALVQMPGATKVQRTVAKVALK